MLAWAGGFPMKDLQAFVFVFSKVKYIFLVIIV